MSDRRARQYTADVSRISCWAVTRADGPPEVVADGYPRDRPSSPIDAIRGDNVFVPHEHEAAGLVDP